MDEEANWSQKFLRGLNDLYQRQIRCDLTFILKDSQTIQVHSPVIYAFLSKLNHGNQIVKCKYPKDVIQPIIDFIYTGNLTLIPRELISDIREAAVEFGFDFLIKFSDNLIKERKRVKLDRRNENPPKRLTSADVFYKYANAGNELSAYSLTAKQTKMVTELYKKNPEMFKGSVHTWNKVGQIYLGHGK